MCEGKFYLSYFSLLTRYYSRDQIKKNEMGRAYGMCERHERCIKAWVGRPQRKRPLGRPRRSGRIILKWVFNKWNGRHGLHLFGSG